MDDRILHADIVTRQIVRPYDLKSYDFLLSSPHPVRLVALFNK